MVEVVLAVALEEDLEVEVDLEVGVDLEAEVALEEAEVCAV